MNTIQLRGAPSGPVLTGTPGNALVMAADGKSVTTAPLPPGFVVEGTPAAGKFVGWDAVNSEAQWQTIPTTFAINSFGLSSASLVLVGATVTNPTFAAAYNQAASSVQLTDTEGNSDAIALPGTAFASPHAFTKTVFGSSVTFTDTAGNGTSSAQASAALFWGQNVYTGSAVDPGGGGYNAAFIQALGTTTLKLGPQGTYAYNAGAGQSAFFCARTAFGLTVANFFVNGFPFACSRVATGVSVTVNGVAENFDIFRSDNTGLGAFNLVEQ